MKNYLIRAIASAVAYVAIGLPLDLMFGRVRSFQDYAVTAVVFGVLFGLFALLDDKGWNSWKKVGALFKRKKSNDHER